MKTSEILVRVGTEITVKALRWNAGWEFDCPTAIIAPVFISAEDGRSIDDLIEDFLINCCIYGKIKGYDPIFWERGRGWSQAYLKRKFYRKGVEHVTKRFRFVLDEYGELTWDEIS